MRRAAKSISQPRKGPSGITSQSMSPASARGNSRRACLAASTESHSAMMATPGRAGPGMAWPGGSKCRARCHACRAASRDALRLAGAADSFPGSRRAGGCRSTAVSWCGPFWKYVSQVDAGGTGHDAHQTSDSMTTLPRWAPDSR